jgi:hypothetical protein
MMRNFLVNPMHYAYAIVTGVPHTAVLLVPHGAYGLVACGEYHQVDCGEYHQVGPCLCLCVHLLVRS